MSKNLVIVESPKKAKTIGQYLGSDYVVMSSQGHIRDIEGIGKNSIGIDFQNGYKPHYVIDSQKAALVENLQKAAKKAEKVWLASDEDREGEAIAWHLQEVLNLSPERTHRIVFHEVTKEALAHAIANPRTIDYNLVNAQQTRRLMDRIVGFELSPVLWRKVTTGLSAGRVQSVVVRLVVEREQEIEAFNSSAHYRVSAEFITTDSQGEEITLKTELNHRFANKTDAMAFLEACKTASFTIQSVNHKPGHRNPAPPFTTSSLQEEAARKLHFTVSKTMRLAQSLYEAGHITYMRTDSETLSSLAIQTAKQEILSEFGEAYHKARQYQTSAKGAQEAHEAIRPTYMNVVTAGSTHDERRLYDLIRKRTLATQMADAQTSTTRVDIAMDNAPYLWVAKHEMVVFDGFMRVYTQSTDDESPLTSTHMPYAALAAQTPCRLHQAVAQETYSKAPARYNDATLVNKMKELGIGRPSTYAPTIETIQTRKYVERGNVEGVKRPYNILTLNGNRISDKTKHEMVGADTGKFLPTDLGRITNDFLVEHFPTILSYDFTARELENIDAVAAGEADWVETVDRFYQTFHPLISAVPSGKMAARYLGQDPATGEPVMARISKIGPCIQIGDNEDQKPRFVSLDKGQSIFTITLEEALALFVNALPYTLAEIDGEKVVVGEGKYGPYLHIGKSYISIPATIDPRRITIDEAKELMAQHQQQQLPIHQWGDIQVMHGKFGVYIKTSEGNYRMPRQIEVAKLTEEQCRQIIADANNPEKPKKSRRK